ncbi:hypothetical protein HMPREF9003_2251 [Bifidobacterium dentium JCVIHMP022]|uniref:Uncharacterized protein n=1 Tax=Bifidobacterium dentium JCVIHMP022 TaxID=553191 RepID=A0AB72Z1Q1_9BIFI|nr:hypothetical protein HMPREF9003_2251 [Bifidobacterium dentium JCVIHMP022]
MYRSRYFHSPGIGCRRTRLSHSWTSDRARLEAHASQGLHHHESGEHRGGHVRADRTVDHVMARGRYRAVHRGEHDDPDTPACGDPAGIPAQLPDVAFDRLIIRLGRDHGRDHHDARNIHAGLAAVLRRCNSFRRVFRRSLLSCLHQCATGQDTDAYEHFRQYSAHAAYSRGAVRADLRRLRGAGVVYASFRRLDGRGQPVRRGVQPALGDRVAGRGTDRSGGRTRGRASHDGCQHLHGLADMPIRTAYGLAFRRPGVDARLPLSECTGGAADRRRRRHLHDQGDVDRLHFVIIFRHFSRNRPAGRRTSHDPTHCEPRRRILRHAHHIHRDELCGMQSNVVDHAHRPAMP